MKNKKVVSIPLVFYVTLVFFNFQHCKTAYQPSNIQTQNNIAISEQAEEDVYVAQFIKPYKQSIDDALDAIIASSTVDLNKQGLSSNLGNLLSDAVLNYANTYSQNHQLPPVDIAILNHGGMRVDIGKGEVSVKKVYELMPFENTLVLVEMTGLQLNGFIDYMLQHKKGHPIAGITLEYEGDRLHQALIGGKPVEIDKTYWIATHNYLYNGGDGMDFFQQNVESLETPIKIRDIFIEEFKRMKVLPDTKEQRLIIR